MQPLRACLQFLALPEEEKRLYLTAIPETPLKVECGDVEIFTRKPLLIIALIVRSKPLPENWLNELNREQRDSIEELRAVLAVMIELSIWDLFDLHSSTLDTLGDYSSVWGACRTLSLNALDKLGWPASAPEVPFGVFLDRFTSAVTGNIPDNLVR